MASLTLKLVAKELDGMFGKDFSKKNPKVLIKFFHAKSIENAAEKISESVESLGTKMELSNIRSGRGMSGMGMDLGMPGLSGGGMGYINEMMDENFKEDMDFYNDIEDDDKEEPDKN